LGRSGLTLHFLGGEFFMQTKRRAFPERNVFLVLFLFILGPGGAFSARAASASRAFQNDFVRVTITEGLSQGTGFAIFQDRQGSSGSGPRTA